MNKNYEEIVKVEILESGELQLVLGSGGKAHYQYVYREARGVHWDNIAGAFKSTERLKWTYAEWFAHILEVCASIGIDLRLAKKPEWIKITDSDRKAILAS